MHESDVKLLVAELCPLLTAPWTVGHQARLSMGFFRQEYISGQPFPSPGDLPDPGMEPGSPALQLDSLLSESLGNVYMRVCMCFVYVYPCHMCIHMCACKQVPMYVCVCIPVELYWTIQTLQSFTPNISQLRKM